MTKLFEPATTAYRDDTACLRQQYVRFIALFGKDVDEYDNPERGYGDGPYYGRDYGNGQVVFINANTGEGFGDGDGAGDGAGDGYGYGFGDGEGIKEE